MLNEAKERNLLVKLFKAYRNDETILNRELTEQELQENLFFKKGDMARTQILAHNNSGYIITEKALKNLKIIIKKNEEAIQYLVGVQSTIRAKVTLRKLGFHKLQYMYLWKSFYCLINEGF